MGVSSKSPLWISEAEVTQLLDMGGAIAALEKGLRAEARGEARSMAKTHLDWDGSNLHAIGAVFPQRGYAGTKTWAHTPGGATPLLTLFEAKTGTLLAVIEAFALGQLRTSGISGLAARYLSRPDTSEMAIIGTGKQALPQVGAVAAVRKLKRVRVYSPTKEKREAFAEKLRKQFSFEITVASSVEEAVKDAPIVTLVTRAKEAFLKPGWIARGAHVNAVGAITPERVEFESALLDRCGVISVDHVESARKLSRELSDYFGEKGDWSRVEPLCKLIARDFSRGRNDDVTLFKAMGMGISDLSLAMEIYELARERGLGHAFPHPERSPIRF